MLSFIGNAVAGPELFHWKASNLIIHLACGCLIYLLTLRLLRYTNTDSRLLAASVTAFWLLHPLHVSTVLYTVQRMTQLSALFTFAALLTYLMARDQQTNGRPFWKLQFLTWVVLFPLGIFSKESALLFPAFVVLLELFLVRHKQINQRQFTALLALLSTIPAAAIALNFDWLTSGYAMRNFTLEERLLTEGRIVVDYLRMLLTPSVSSMGFMHDDYVISRNLLTPWSTLPALLMIVLLLTLSLFLRAKYPLIGMGILFFLVGHSLESTIIPLELMFEHRNYVPSFGILLASACAIRSLTNNKIITTLAGCTAILLFTFVLSIRTNTWSSIDSIHFHMAMHHRNSERLSAAQARQQAEAGSYDLARKKIERFNSLGSQLHRLQIDCLANGQLHDRQLAVAIDPTTAVDNYAIMSLTDIANLGLDKQCSFSTDRFLDLLGTLRTEPILLRNHRKLIMMYQAHYLWEAGREDDALLLLADTFQLDSSSPVPLFLACERMLDTDRLTQAETTCATALRVADRDKRDRYDEFAIKVKERLQALGKDPH